MPMCTCGCNQDLTRRAIKNHLQGRTIPRLVTAAVKASQTLRSTISPGRLNPLKKLRSSRRYFPSPPASVIVDEDPDFVMSDGIGDGEDNNISAGGEEHTVIEEADAIDRAIGAALGGVWSGLHHDDDDAEEDYDEDRDDEGEEEVENDTEREVVEDAYDSWDDHEIGLSALDMLGEEFERKSIANGEFPCTSFIHNFISEVL
jgi:hypothetical protein